MPRRRYAGPNTPTVSPAHRRSSAARSRWVRAVRASGLNAHSGACVTTGGPWTGRGRGAAAAPVAADPVGTETAGAAVVARSHNARCIASCAVSAARCAATTPARSSATGLGARVAGTTAGSASAAGFVSLRAGRPGPSGSNAIPSNSRVVIPSTASPRIGTSPSDRAS
ncbi:MULTISPECIES: phosphorylase family protein [Nocardia]|uniref:phosphorylase family protein n=1 Tax=Nocardia TaxID=1817 RepID=UPI0034D56068